MLQRCMASFTILGNKWKKILLLWLKSTYFLPMNILQLYQGRIDGLRFPSSKILPILIPTTFRSNFKSCLFDAIGLERSAWRLMHALYSDRLCHKDSLSREPLKVVTIGFFKVLSLAALPLGKGHCQ